MKTENENKRNKRKEIQFSEAEYATVEKKANAARLSVAAFIRETALGKELSAALTIEESERMKRTANISYKMQVNLNQIARLANIHDLPFVTDAIREYYLYTAEGEHLFCERHNCRIYPDNRGIYWHFKVADYPAYTLPAEISRAYLNHEISIRDVYVHWRKNER